MSSKLVLFASLFAACCVTSVFAQDATPGVRFTGEQARCVSRWDADHEWEVVSNMNFNLKTESQAGAPVGQSNLVVTFDARYSVCKADPKASSGFSFQRRPDRIGGGIDKHERYMYVVTVPRPGKKEDAELSSNGFHHAIQWSAVGQMEDSGPYTNETLTIPMNKILTPAECTELAQSGKLSKKITIFMSYDGMHISTLGGMMLGFDLTYSSAGVEVSAPETHQAYGYGY